MKRKGRTSSPLSRARPTCSNCGEEYYRRCLVEAWDIQNPGHRIGWHKTIMRICTRCSNAARSKRLLAVSVITTSRETRKLIANSTG